jgi:hypothetical protein
MPLYLINLSDAFPDEYKKKFASDNFKLGAVIKCYCPIADKEKRMILMGHKFDKKSIALVHINSEVNEIFFPTEYLKSLHLPLKCAGREYLTHDSFVHCGQLILRKYAEVYKLFESTPAILLGHVSEADYKDIRNIIKGAKTISPADKKEFGLFL